MLSVVIHEWLRCALVRSHHTVYLRAASNLDEQEKRKRTAVLWVDMRSLICCELKWSLRQQKLLSNLESEQLKKI